MNRSHLTAGAIAIAVAAVLSNPGLTPTWAQNANPGNVAQPTPNQFTNEPVAAPAPVFDYRVLASVGLGTMEPLVREWKAKGYTCQGGISVNRDSNGTMHLFQAMVKQ